MNAAKNFHDAARALLHELLKQLEETDPQGLAAVNQAAHAGSAFQCVVGLSVQGLQEIQINLIAPTGETLQLSRVECFPFQ